MEPNGTVTPKIKHIFVFLPVVPSDCFGVSSRVLEIFVLQMSASPLDYIGISALLLLLGALKENV